jgi:hypothetical protein
MDRAFSPCIQKEVKVVPGPQGAGSAVQLIEVPLNLPTPADQVKLLTGVAILVDKASLLSGDATSRVETAKLSGTELDAQLKYRRDEIARRREQKQRIESASTGRPGELRPDAVSPQMRMCLVVVPMRQRHAVGLRPGLVREPAQSFNFSAGVNTVPATATSD